MGNSFYKGKEVLGTLPSNKEDLLCYMLTRRYASAIKRYLNEFDRSWGEKESMPHINLDEYPLQNGYEVEFCLPSRINITITYKEEFMVIFILDGKEYYGRFKISDSESNEDESEAVRLHLVVDDYKYFIPHTLQQAALICNQHVNSHDSLTRELFECLIHFFDNDYFP